MSQLFTIKLDISDLVENSLEPKTYVLLVDPNKMTMIHEFKEWIRLLFSLEDYINLVYEGSVIHDLEDIQILSILKCVQVQRCLFGESSQFRLEKVLQGKMNKDCPLENSKIAALFVQKLGFIFHTYNQKAVQTTESSASFSSVHTDQNQNSQHSVPNCTKSNMVGYNLMKADPNFIFMNDPKNVERNNTNITNYVQESQPCSSDQFVNDKNDKNATQLHQKFISRNILDTKEMHSQLINEDISTKNDEFHESNDSVCVKSGKIVNKDLVSNHFNPVENDILKDSSVTNSLKSRLKKKNYIKPFCVGEILNSLRMNKVSISEGHAINITNDTSHDGKGYETFEEALSPKKNRKRIRKHKSKKKTQYSNEECFPNPVAHCDRTPVMAPESNKPKHIRFEEECNVEEDDNHTKANINTNEVDCYTNDPGCNMVSNVDHIPNEEINVESLRHLIHEKWKNLKSSSLSNPANLNYDTHNFSSTPVSKEDQNSDEEMLMDHSISTPLNGSSLLKTEDNCVSSVTNNTDILDELANLRSKYSTAPIFKRYN